MGSQVPKRSASKPMSMYVSWVQVFLCMKDLFKSYTPWKTKMEPENDGLEDDFPFQLGGF